MLMILSCVFNLRLIFSWKIQTQRHGVARFLPWPRLAGSGSARFFNLELGASQRGGDKRNINRVDQLTRYGSAGILSYGVLNLLYYSAATSVAVLLRPIAPPNVTGRMVTGVKIQYAMKYIGSLMGVVWAGSQVTKPARLGAAIALAPLCERTLDLIQRRLGIQRASTTLYICVASIWVICALFYAILLYISLMKI